LSALRNLHAISGPSTLKEAAAKQIREAIVSGHLAPGTILRDAELAMRLGLSATPVREALGELAAAGLVEIEPNRGKRVTPIDLSAMVELFEVQIRLWALGYQWGAPKVGGPEVARLHAAQAAHGAAIDAGRASDAIDAAHAFHRVLMEASGNRELLRVSLDRLPLIHRFVLLCAPELVAQRGVDWHGEILDALEAHDHARALATFELTGAALLAAATNLRDLTSPVEKEQP
jgi:DNA-binding GntR family transcriptional regulator